MKILITGAGGMVGSHMSEYYTNRNDSVTGTYYKPTTLIKHIPADVNLVECDVRYYKPLYAIIEETMPDRIFHLAAQSYPTVSLIRPEETMHINAIGTINVFEAVKQIRLSNPAYNPPVVVACSSAEYGASLTPENTPVKESATLFPLHPYGVSKVAQDLLSYQYFASDGLHAIRARIFNTTGPRKVNDVCADFTKRAIEIEKGIRKELTVGNIHTKRAISDVRDLISALDLLSEKGEPGEVYNISGQNVYEISRILEIIKAEIKVDFDIRVDESLLRPTDEPVIYGDSSKLAAATGWSQKYTIETTIRDMLAYWRANI